MGAERTELLDGQLYWPGDFDERDAMVARRALPGSRIRVDPGAGLIAGPVPEDEPQVREWTDADGPCRGGRPPGDPKVAVLIEQMARAA
jgi:hypothetical protein